MELNLAHQGSERSRSIIWTLALTSAASGQNRTSDVSMF